MGAQSVEVSHLPVFFKYGSVTPWILRQHAQVVGDTEDSEPSTTSFIHSTSGIHPYSPSVPVCYPAVERAHDGVLVIAHELDILLLTVHSNSVRSILLDILLR